MISAISTQRYLVAKYVADRRRQEPRNVGVIVWANGSTAVRFLKEAEITSFVNDSGVFRRWVELWKRLCSQSEIDAAELGVVGRDDPRFLDAMHSFDSGSYYLEDGGMILEPFAPEEIDGVAEFLFEEVVAIRPGRAHFEHSPSNFQHRCTNLFQQAGIRHDPHFRRNHNVPCHVERVWKELRFHYAMANGNPFAAFHRVAVENDQSVTSAAFMFEWVQKSNVLERDQCGVLIESPGSFDRPVNSSVDLLDQFANVIQIDAADAADSVREIAGI